MAHCQRQALLVVCCLLATVGYTAARQCVAGSAMTVPYTSSCCNSITLGYFQQCCVDVSSNCFCVSGMPSCTAATTPGTTTPAPPTTTPPTTTPALRSTARCPAPTGRLIGGTTVPMNCSDPGIIGVQMANSKLCTGLYVYDQQLAQRVCRFSELCYTLMKDALQYPGVSIRGRIQGNLFNITASTFSNTNFGNLTITAYNGSVTLIPTLETERMLNGFVSRCPNVACELRRNIPADDVDFQNCTLYSYGPTKPGPAENDTADDSLQMLKVHRYNGWDEADPCRRTNDLVDAAATFAVPPNDNDICFLPNSQATGYSCKISDNSALFCWTRDGADFLAMGFTFPVGDCSSSTPNFLVYPSYHRP